MTSGVSADALANAPEGPRAGRGPRWTFVVLVVAATIGGSLLAVIIGTFWREAGDNFAYWIAADRLAHGQPIYSPPEVAFEPFAYHYPPPLAQALAPLTLVISPVVYAILYRAAMLLALWELAGRRMLWMLAFIAFIPVAIAVRIENVELFIALVIVLGLGRFPWLFSIGALVKASPGLGIVYLVLRRRWRDAAIAAAVGVGVVAVSYLVAPELWPAWIGSISGREGMVGNSLVPVPYAWRALAGLGLAIVAGLVGRRSGELLLVAAVTIANPGLSLQGFAVLAACVPIWLAGPEGVSARAPRREPARTDLRGDAEVSPA